ncbi:GAP family protein [Mycobacterium sp. DSM 3803]|nr:GAP family protein [Mycobacterium sp. DSM 3803]
MWGDILGWALLVGFNPMLFGAIVLVISRPRPVQNLFAFWVSCLVVNLLALWIPLMVLHRVPSFVSVAQDLATPDPASGVQPLQLGMGVFAVSLAVLMLIQSRRRQRVTTAVVAGSDSSVLVKDSDETTGTSDPAHTGDGLKTAPSPLRRLTARARDEWNSGALWVSMALSLIYMLPPPLILLISTIIVGSGTAIATQVVAVVVFVAVMLVVFEITLLSYVVAPAKTHAVLEPVHGWALAHRTQILIVMFALVGIWQVLTGLGIV